MKSNTRKKRPLPLTTAQGILLSLAIAILLALAFAVAFHVYSLPVGSE